MCENIMKPITLYTNLKINKNKKKTRIALSKK